MRGWRTFRGCRSAEAFSVRAVAGATLDAVCRGLPQRSRFVHHGRFAEQREERLRYLIAWRADVAVGHAVLIWPESRHASEFAEREWCVEVGDIFVVPWHRRRGAARALMAAAESAALEHGVPKLGLATALDEGYAAARCLYAELGYTDAGHGVFLQTAAIPDDLGGRQVFTGTLVYLTKTLR